MSIEYADLHVHTTNSDGALTPREVIALAKSNGIAALAITDHNVLLDDFEELQKENPEIDLVRGVEISALHTFRTGKKLEIHIVGLFLENVELFEEFLKTNRTDGSERVKAHLKRLKDECGLSVGSYEDLKKMYPDRRIGRMQLAEAMVVWGISESVTDAFDTYIGDYGKKLAWVENPVKFASIPKVVEEIKLARGISVLAHPLSYKLTDEEFQELMECFSDAGGNAIETEYAKYEEWQRRFLLETATKWGLGFSCASDFHGKFEGETLEGQFSIIDYWHLYTLRNNIYCEFDSQDENIDNKNTECL